MLKIFSEGFMAVFITFMKPSMCDNNFRYTHKSHYKFFLFLYNYILTLPRLKPQADKRQWDSCYQRRSLFLVSLTCKIAVCHHHSVSSAYSRYGTHSITKRVRLWVLKCVLASCTWRLNTFYRVEEFVTPTSYVFCFQRTRLF